VLALVFPLAVLVVIVGYAAVTAHGHQVSTATLRQLTPAELRRRCHAVGRDGGGGSRLLVALRRIRRSMAGWMLLDEEPGQRPAREARERLDA